MPNNGCTPCGSDQLNQLKMCLSQVNRQRTKPHQHPTQFTFEISSNILHGAHRHSCTRNDHRFMWWNHKHHDAILCLTWPQTSIVRQTTRRNRFDCWIFFNCIATVTESQSSNRSENHSTWTYGRTTTRFAQSTKVWANLKQCEQRAHFHQQTQSPAATS